MANKTVKIYERVKLQGKWTDRAVPIPKLKADGMMYLKDDREGKFHISWYEGKIKKWHSTTCTTLSEALRVKADKEWFVQNQNRPGVQDPTLPDARLPISVAINGYIDALTGERPPRKRIGTTSASSTMFPRKMSGLTSGRNPLRAESRDG